MSKEDASLNSCATSVDVLLLAFIGHPRRVMFSGSRIPNRRGFSITRLEGRRWRLRRTPSVHGESTKESFQTRLVKGVKPVENFDILNQRVVNHAPTILQPSAAEREDV